MIYTFLKLPAGVWVPANVFQIGRREDMTETEKKSLQITACKLRKGIVTATHAAKSGHAGGSLSAADMFTYLYFRELNIDPADPDSETRDRFVLSKGHTAPGLYSALALRGFFAEEELKTLRHIGSRLQGHPNMNETPGVDMSTGSLGQGVSAAAGMALGAKYMGKDLRVYTLLGDGEIEEGQVWEAMMFAHHHKLDNLCVIVDNNGLQIDGRIADVMSPYPIPDKLRAFGLHVIEIDGHDFEQIEAAFSEARSVKGVPSAIVMKTVKGKGVSFMEDKAGWHGKAPNDEELQIALNELDAQLAELEGK
ncbi:MAG: transketolase [Oscillospiraceae bacterium]|nr:transketolase [Oscillospiraceae bacterium]